MLWSLKEFASRPPLSPSMPVSWVVCRSCHAWGMPRSAIPSAQPSHADGQGLSLDSSCQSSRRRSNSAASCQGFPPRRPQLHSNVSGYVAVVAQARTRTGFWPSWRPQGLLCRRCRRRCWERTTGRRGQPTGWSGRASWDDAWQPRHQTQALAVVRGSSTPLELGAPCWE
jgi:hypothetical protein